MQADIGKEFYDALEVWFSRLGTSMGSMAEFARKTIIRRTLSGIDANGTPFAPYNPKYERWKGSGQVNLSLSGEMLGALAVDAGGIRFDPRTPRSGGSPFRAADGTYAARPVTATIGFGGNARAERKAAYAEAGYRGRPKRPFMGLTPLEVQESVDKFAVGMGNIPSSNQEITVAFRF